MLTRLAAQGLTDVLAATALEACVVAALRRGVRSPVGARIIFAFGCSTLFFLCRGASEALRNAPLGVMAEGLAVSLPLAGLFLTEGLLRRHAPRVLKAAIVVGGVAVMSGLAVYGARPPVSSWGLGGYLTVSILAFVALLFTRSRTSLSHQENARIDALMLAGAGLGVLSLTDFLPGAPIGMSGLGAALLALFTHHDALSPKGVRQAFRELLVIAFAAALFTASLFFVVHPEDGGEGVRLWIVVLTLMIALVTLIDALRQQAGEDEALALRKALAVADTSSLSAFLDSLAGHPLLRGLNLMDGARLADYEPVALAAAFETGSVQTRRRLGDASGGAALGREQLLDLMAGAEASHAALISRRPVRIALLTLPEIGSADEVEADFNLFCKLAAIAAETRL